MIHSMNLVITFMIHTMNLVIYSQQSNIIFASKMFIRTRRRRARSRGAMQHRSPQNACCRACIVGYCHLVVWMTHVVQSCPSSEKWYIRPTCSEQKLSVGIDLIPKPAAWATRDVRTRMYQWKLKAPGYHCRNQELTKCHSNAASAKAHSQLPFYNQRTRSYALSMSQELYILLCHLGSS